MDKNFSASKNFLREIDTKSIFSFQNGDFLVRDSGNTPGQYVLSGMQSNSKKHLLLVDPNGIVSIIDEKVWNFKNFSFPHILREINFFSGENQRSNVWFRQPFNQLSQGKRTANHFSRISFTINYSYQQKFLIRPFTKPLKVWNLHELYFYSTLYFLKNSESIKNKFDMLVVKCINIYIHSTT